MNDKLKAWGTKKGLEGLEVRQITRDLWLVSGWDDSVQATCLWFYQDTIDRADVEMLAELMSFAVRVFRKRIEESDLPRFTIQTGLLCHAVIQPIEQRVYNLRFDLPIEVLE